MRAQDKYYGLTEGKRKEYDTNIATVRDLAIQEIATGKVTPIDPATEGTKKPNSNKDGRWSHNNWQSGFSTVPELCFEEMINEKLQRAPCSERGSCCGKVMVPDGFEPIDICHTNNPVLLGGTDWGCQDDKFCSSYTTEEDQFNKVWHVKGKRNVGTCTCAPCSDYKTEEQCDNAGFKQIGSLVDCYSKCLKKRKFFDFKCYTGDAQKLAV